MDAYAGFRSLSTAVSIWYGSRIRAFHWYYSWTCRRSRSRHMQKWTWPVTLTVNLSWRKISQQPSDLTIVDTTNTYCHVYRLRVILKSVQKRPEAYIYWLEPYHTGHKDNAGTTAHVGTSVLALGWQIL